jgi:DNA helicase-2/ATP-dependent DNA helicase PcrA
VLHAMDVPLQIVAGPGSGKTTVLVLRALRHVLVDGLLPEQVMLTTFTKKAAAEIRTRLIEWGQSLVNYLQRTATGALATHLANIDVNRFLTGTLDSICEEALRSSRSATDPAPVLLEGFAADAILLRKGLRGTVYSGMSIDRSVATLLRMYTFDNNDISNAGELIKVVRPLYDRFHHDQIDLTLFRAKAPADARDALARGFEQYGTELSTTNRLDFAQLEAIFLERLLANRMSRFTGTIRALLVDEYQDTNLLQERIYFELYRCIQQGSLSVVGDDDQSLYRFRGATVELFRDFSTRLQAAIPGVIPQREDLVSNYRSTPEIISYFNSFITNDPDFAPARVQPAKPQIVAELPSVSIPVLGMFRSSTDDLSRDLVEFLFKVFRGPGYRVSSGTTLRADPNGGDFGDAVVLAHSVNEYTTSYMGSAPRARLPYLVRQQMQARGADVFNPRGRALRDIPDVQRLVGAMLECIDPGASLQGTMRIRANAQQALNVFRSEYDTYASGNPAPAHPHGLRDFVDAWGHRRPMGQAQWPSEWPLLELCFKLLCWFPALRDNPEGQIHIEAIARAISQSAAFSPYRAQIVNVAHGSTHHNGRSVEAAIRDIFSPLGEGLIDVDEEIMPHIPRDRLSLMTIHQAKGLEFPLVIVDVSSDFATNHPKQRFRRFPESPSNVTTLEDDVAEACSIGSLRQTRTALQRTFEDLTRLYYVAYSRPQVALLLVGLRKSLQYNTNIKNVATFWRADSTWPWQRPHSGPRPGMADNIPLELI